MRIVQKYLPAGKVARALWNNAPSAVLSLEARRRSRQKLQLTTGEEVGLALPHGTVLREGDLLLADDGQFIVVQAANEPVLRVTAKTAQQLARAAYHLGNRHILLEIGPDYLHLEYDPVLVDMLERMGGVSAVAVEQPFEPETGAYGGGHKHGHDETFAEDYALAQDAYKAHDHGHAHSHDQAHGAGHGHAHGHDHKHSHK
ncbi:urease accessory protein UreE [Eoetvoesiella caeni]|uniref:Urease accessory protein UreE n=1 Tax=Eoetvoesiella caeni TaxID=645616 RepID=A0A366HJW6_9BURK|nr:urease accessory protein UreE [Eoetvoesiella caeni]MCI2808060.1 urease accessory protein UreE [Eoetvoesiella caeni]NYT53937.1 urease accessory protein UreE [Eoetvoesiella caeni]RBP41980.1 urease accessory protein [Eoetvoesiella caeni]